MSRNHPESGLTLIECLVALVVISTTIATLTPVVLFSVATRIQNQKTEQALQLAQAEIDKVRLIVEKGGDYGTELSLVKILDDSAAAAPAPTSFIASTATATAITEARKVDLDGDGDTDFAVQIFRTEGEEVGAANSPVVFEMGVRVYDARAEANLTTPGLTTERGDLTFTSGEGDRGTQPLAVLYTKLSQGDRLGSLCELYKDANPADTIPIEFSCS